MKITHGIEYAFVRLMAFLFRKLPRKTALSLGEKLGKAVDNIWLSRHKTILQNLKIAYGDEFTEARREEIARAVFVNIGKTMAEFSRFPLMTNEEILELVTGEGVDVFEEVLDYGKGGVMVSSHFGNWELLGAYGNALGYPIDFMVRGQHNKLVDSYVTKLRGVFGVRVIHSEEDGGMLNVIRALRNNRQVAIASDQHAGPQGIIVKFFGQPVSVSRAPAILSIRTGAPIVTGHIVRREDNTHYCYFDKPLYPDMGADREKEIFHLTQIYTERIEKMIRLYPELWLWTHRRFKYTQGTKLSKDSGVE